MYITLEEYTELGYTKITNEVDLDEASIEVDALTFNRINKKGWQNLTDYQRNLLTKAICEIADFNSENADILSTLLDSYSINGVSMKFTANSNMINTNGYLLPKKIYRKIEMTGLNTLRLM